MSDNLASARGCLLGVAIGAVLWLIIGLTVLLWLPLAVGHGNAHRADRETPDES
ncbi:MAG TPA: hypothetical protein VN631_10140 [Negativicutes bacterium]|nr:hypothetical protein [Negativicutes bacterium]